MKLAPRLLALHRWFALAAVALASHPLEAIPARTRPFALAAGPAEKTLGAFAQQAGVELIFSPEKVEGVRTNAVRGRLATMAALERLLDGTGLGVVRDESTGALAVQRIPAGPAPRKKPPPELRPREEGSREKDAPIELSPFAINTSKDRGYLAANTRSGFGIDTPIMQLPQTIQIANRQLIEDLGAGSGELLNALEMASGSIVRRSFNNGDDQFLWGFRIGSTARDGVPTGATNPQGVFYDIDRVEAIKGPAAPLFGQASFIGGVINYVPRLPSKKRRRTVSVTVGSWNLHSAEIHLAGPINDRLRYRADFGCTDRGGERAFTFWHDRFAGAAFEYDLGPGTTLLLEGHHFTNERANSTTLADGVLRNGQDLAPHPLLGRTLSLNTPQDRTDYGRDMWTAKLRATLPGGIASQTFVNWTRVTVDMARAQGRPQADGYDPVALTAGRQALRFLVSEPAWFCQQTWQKTLPTGPFSHNLTLMGDTLLRNHADATTFYAIAPLDLRNPDYSPFLFQLPNDRPENEDGIRQSRIRSSGATFGDVVSFWDHKLSLLYSLRYSETRQVDNRWFVGTGLDPNSPAFSRSDVMSRRDGITFAPVENLLFYVNRGSAFIFYSSLDFPNASFLPSTATNHEVGAKASWWGGALSLTVAHFQIDVNNVRVVDSQGIRQDGSQSNRGWDVSAVLSRQFPAGAANLLLTAYAGNVRNEFGQKPIHAVNNTWSVWGTFRFRSGAARGLKLGAGANFIGSRVGAIFHAQLGGGPTRVEAYTRVRAMASYTWKNFTLQVNGDNLTNVDAIDSYESSQWLTTEPGRRYRATLSYSF